MAHGAPGAASTTARWVSGMVGWDIAGQVMGGCLKAGLDEL